MKEYKVIHPNLGFKNITQDFEDILNKHAREGWQVIDIGQNWGSVIFERDKNR
jgi:hypothetical protein